MGKALYRQYRSSSFDEVIGQEHITRTLQNSLQSGSIAHAYLLTGPRGVGKTSIARILAYAVNDLPYEKDATHLDIIEIDAASNRRIDEIRSLREKVHIAPVSAKYKVYIIDEVHMLTREAFNALLKTLEEPPQHVIFILATTELHKLPDTIVSRCITFAFRPIPEKLIQAHLKHIAEQEKIQISSEALELLAQHGDGSFRDSISLLDQVRQIGDNIDVSDVEMALGLADHKTVDNIINAIAAHSPVNLNKSLDSAYSHGANELNLTKQISARLREEILSGNSRIQPEDATLLLKRMIDVPASLNPRSVLELVLLSQLFKGQSFGSNTQSSEKIQSMPQKPAKLEAVVEVKPLEKPTPSNKPTDKSEEHPQKREEESQVKLVVNSELWDNILSKLKKQNNTLYGVARMAEARVDEGGLYLTLKFPFHYKQLSTPKNKSLITAIISDLGHQDLKLEINLQEKENAQTSSSNKDPKDNSLENITNIFGEGEVIES